MNFLKYLAAAGVPEHLWSEAVTSIEDADRRSDGLLWFKIKVRLWNADKISKLIPWEAERLLDVRPDLASWDIAPMIHITAHGDNVPWPYGIPAPGQWLDPNDQEAISKNYWCKGEHPRSQKSRKAWYRRNGGEYEAWRRGLPIDVSQARIWESNGVKVYECSGAWEIIAKDKWLGVIPVKVRVGFEIDNVWRSSDNTQNWYPLPGYEQRAPVTWSVIPSKN
jgi:hypothetical protein